MVSKLLNVCARQLSCGPFINHSFFIYHSHQPLQILGAPNLRGGIITTITSATLNRSKAFDNFISSTIFNPRFWPRSCDGSNRLGVCKLRGVVKEGGGEEGREEGGEAVGEQDEGGGEEESGGGSGGGNDNEGRGGDAEGGEPAKKRGGSKAETERADEVEGRRKRGEGSSTGSQTRRRRS